MWDMPTGSKGTFWSASSMSLLDMPSISAPSAYAGTSSQISKSRRQDVAAIMKMWPCKKMPMCSACIINRLHWSRARIHGVQHARSSFAQGTKVAAQLCWETKQCLSFSTTRNTWQPAVS